MAVLESVGSWSKIHVCVQVSRRFAVWRLLFIVKVRRSCIQHLYSSSPPFTTTTPQLGTCANSKWLCLSTAIPKNSANAKCANAAVCSLDGKSPHVTAHLRATIKQQDFPVTGPQSSAEHQKNNKKRRKKCHVLKQGGRLSGKDRQKNVTSWRPGALLRAYASRKALNTAPWICEFCVKCLTTKGPPHQFWWRRSAYICTRVDHFLFFFALPTDKNVKNSWYLAPKKPLTTER